MDIEFRWLDIGGARPLIPQLRTRWPGDANWPWSAIPQSGIPIVDAAAGRVVTSVYSPTPRHRAH
jgi:hypothetical protein